MFPHDIRIVPSFYLTYIRLVPEQTLPEALENGLNALDADLEQLLLELGDAVYEPGKWTVKDILQHLIDTERIMSYRALRFARQDDTALPGFDENEYAAAANASRRTVADLLEELRAVRLSSLHLFRSLSEAQLAFSGQANGNEISVLALGFVIAGHQLHHLRIIRERYLPLLQSKPSRIPA